MVADLRRDTRYAVRMLARTPAFTFVICLTLALGIGATAVIFSAVDAVLLQRAPVADPSSVTSIYTTSSDGRDRFSTTSYPDYVDLRDSGIFGGLVAFASVPFVLQGSNGAESLPGELVTGNYFDVLGVRIPLGRTFSVDEDKPGAPIRVVILSHGAWTARFGADRSIVGRQITLNGNSYSIVGVAPQGFRRADSRPRSRDVGTDGPSTGAASAKCGATSSARRHQHARRTRPTVDEHDRTSGRPVRPLPARPRPRTRSRRGWTRVTRVPIAAGGSPSSLSAMVPASARRRDRCCGCSARPSSSCC